MKKIFIEILTTEGNVLTHTDRLYWRSMIDVVAGTHHKFDKVALVLKVTDKAGTELFKIRNYETYTQR